jgi:hypothetical protein
MTCTTLLSSLTNGIFTTLGVLAVLIPAILLGMRYVSRRTGLPIIPAPVPAPRESSRVS